MDTYYVICITKKPNHSDPHTAIQDYGVAANVMATVPSERWTQAKMIEILEGKKSVVKSIGENPATGKFEYAELEVITKSNGSKYVKSVNDGEKLDNLLKRPECSSLGG